MPSSEPKNDRSQSATSAQTQLAIVLDEQSREAWSTVVNPHRFVKVPDYIIYRWTAHLGASRTLLLLAFRQAAFVTRSKEPFGEEVARVTYSQMSKWSGLSVGAVHKLLSDPGYLTWFIRGIGDKFGQDGRPLTNRDQRTYHVRVDIPLTPQDQVRLTQHLAANLPEDDEGWLRLLHEAIAAKKLRLGPDAALDDAPKSIQEIVRALRGAGDPLPPELDHACVELYEQWVGSNFGQASHYFLQLWVPELPPALACLILWARRRAYAESDEAQIKQLRVKDESALARAVGVSKKTVRRWRKRDLTPLFLTFIDQYEGTGNVESIDSKTIVIDGRRLELLEPPVDGEAIRPGDYATYEATAPQDGDLVLRSIRLANQLTEPRSHRSAGAVVEVRMSDPVHPGDWERYTRLLEGATARTESGVASGATDGPVPEVNDARTIVNDPGPRVNEGHDAETSRTRVNNLDPEVNTDEPELNDLSPDVNDGAAKVKDSGTEANALRGKKTSISESKVRLPEQPPQEVPAQDQSRGVDQASPQVVVASHQDWNIEGILQQGAVPNRDREQLLAGWPENQALFIGWLLFGLAQESIRYPVLYAVRRAVEGEQPPSEYFELARGASGELSRYLRRYSVLQRVPENVEGAVNELRAAEAREKLLQLQALPVDARDDAPPGWDPTGTESPTATNKSAPADQMVIHPAGKTAAQVWEEALGQLQMELPRAEFESWVRDARFVNYDDGVFEIGAHNEYARGWIEDRLAATIGHVLAGIVGKKLSVRFVVL